jgi:hypothetical protein
VRLAAEDGVGGGALVQAVEAGAELVGGGGIELDEDVLGLPPGLAGRVEVAGAPVRLAELGENAGLAVAVAELAEQVEGPPVAADGLGLVAEVPVGVAQARPGVGLVGAVVQLLVQAQRLAAEGQRLPVVPEPAVDPAHIGERDRPPDPVAGDLEQLQGSLADSSASASRPCCS